LKFLNSNIKPKKFGYFPRYYDARREKTDLKKKLYSGEKLSEDERVKLMREKMEEQKQENRVSKNSVYSQNTRTLVLLSVIIVLGYFLLNGLDEIDQVIFKLMR
jgi:hypothetical protein|tara:strand:+ start:821 stop:1132 length:312 start_codon:yes stop_codon:yes gene_type:complete